MPSSVISTMNYDSRKKALTIVFRGQRGVYRYHGVAPGEYAEFCAAPSKGTYLNQIFKAKQHPFERLQTSQVIHLVQKSKLKAADQGTGRGKDHRTVNH